jgi:D-tagatose-1,6-bisphosphate aldolase subunit GatZ/KbaZ
LLGAQKSSQLMKVLEQVMLEDRHYWERYYSADEAKAALQRRYSDRVRYYWNESHVKAAMATLTRNLQGKAIPETMLSAYLPDEYRAVRARELQPEAKPIVLHHIRLVLREYAEACRG